MKAIIKNSSKPYDLSIQTVDQKEVDHHECEVKVSSVGICGSDLHMYAGHAGYDWINYPLTLGHEIMGTVVKTGKFANDSLIGKRVIINPYVPCRECEFCKRGEENRCDGGIFHSSKKAPASLQYGFRKNGGMAEYLTVPQENVALLPEEVSDEVGSIIEAVAVGLTAVEKVENISQKSVVVFGPGPIGLGIISLLVGLHAKKIVVAGTSDDKERLKKAKELGADETLLVDQSEVQDLLRLESNGHDVVIDSSGHPSVPPTSIQLLKKGGELVLVGISADPFSLPADQIVRGELQVKGSYGITDETFRKTISYAQNPEFPFEKLIHNTFDYNRVDDAFQQSLNKAPGKVVIQFNQSNETK